MPAAAEILRKRRRENGVLVVDGFERRVWVGAELMSASVPTGARFGKFFRS